MSPLTDAFAAWARRREARAVLAELESYSDRELGEIGLARSDLPRVAAEEAERRVATPGTGRAAPAWRGPGLLVQGRYQGC
jgi:uncharacterized protein YjiS (DUF1127 family)